MSVTLREKIEGLTRYAAGANHHGAYFYASDDGDKIDRSEVLALVGEHEKADLQRDRWDCLTCWRGVAVDEDGCCATCGRAGIPISNGTPHHRATGRCDNCGAKADLKPVREYFVCEHCGEDDTQ